MHASKAQLRASGLVAPAISPNPKRALFRRNDSSSHLIPRRVEDLIGAGGYMPNLEFAPARLSVPGTVVERYSAKDWRSAVGKDPELAAFYGDRVERIAPKPGRGKGNGRGTVRTEAEVYAMLAEAVGGRSTVEHRSEW